MLVYMFTHKESIEVIKIEYDSCNCGEKYKFGNDQEGTDGSDLPCLNCRLIEMGEMACYTERCPQCGNVPPCRKESYPDVRNTQLIVL